MYKRNFVWNSIASIINAAEAVFMSMVVTRVTNISDAGVLAIAFAVGNLMSMIGKFGVRGFHVTDVRGCYSYSEYFKARCVSVLLMIFAVCLYGCFKWFVAKDSVIKIGCVLAICCIYCVEAVEDVIWGECQRKDRLDLGAKLFIVRWISIFITFFFSMFFTRSLLLALWCSFAFSLISFIVAYRIIVLHEISISMQKGGTSKLIQGDNVFEIMKKCTPLFVMNFLYFYINNAAKYAIDDYGMNDEQAYYGFIAMPIFVIELLNGMIYQPSVVRLTKMWVDGNISAFKLMVKKQFTLIVFIGIMCIVIVAVIGVPILSIIYNVCLSDYWVELVLLQVAGLVLAMIGYLTVLLTVTRQQKWMMLFYFIVSVFAFIAMRSGVAMGGIKGAVVVHILCLVLLFVMKFLRFFIVVNVRK